MVPPPLLRRIRLTLVALLVVASAMAWLAFRPLPPTAAPETAHRQTDIPLTDVAPYGANFFLEREVDPWVRRKTVEMARQAGIRWAKQQFLWAYIEPRPGDFDFTGYDEIVDLFRANDMEVIARLDWPPPWVPKAAWVPASFAQQGNAPPAHLDDYARFVAATAQHFRGRVRFYQIWNEPNLVFEWGSNPSHPADPEEYVAMLAVAARALREADPDAVVLSAPMAINLESPELAGNMGDLDYLRGMYEAGAAAHFDVLSANAFGMDAPPDAPPGEQDLNFRRVELQREVMEAHGDGDKPVWLAEYGWNASPPGVDENTWQRVSERQQAEFTVDGVRWADAHWPWSGVMSVWFFRQGGHLDPERAVYYFRMVDVDFTPRRVHASVQADAMPRVVAGPGVWQERSAPVALPTVVAERDLWRWTWEEGAVDRGALTSVEPGASVGFTFRGRSVGARMLMGPQAGSFEAAVDGRRVSGPDGQPVWALQAADRTWRWLDLADGLGDGVHEVRLTVGTAGGAVTLDAWRVDVGTDASPRVPAIVVLGLIGLFLVVLLVTDGRRVLSRVGR